MTNTFKNKKCETWNNILSYLYSYCNCGRTQRSFRIRHVPLHNNRAYFSKVVHQNAENVVDLKRTQLLPLDNKFMVVDT